MELSDVAAPGKVDHPCSLRTRLCLPCPITITSSGVCLPRESPTLLHQDPSNPPIHNCLQILCRFTRLIARIFYSPSLIQINYTPKDGTYAPAKAREVNRVGVFGRCDGFPSTSPDHTNKVKHTDKDADKTEPYEEGSKRAHCKPEASAA